MKPCQLTIGIEMARVTRPVSLVPHGDRQSNRREELLVRRGVALPGGLVALRHRDRAATRDHPVGQIGLVGVIVVVGLESASWPEVRCE